MEQFPHPPDGFRDFLDIITEPMFKAKLLLTAVEFCLFANLQELQTSVEVAETLGLHPINTEYFLDGLCVCKWLTKENVTYFNSDYSLKSESALKDEISFMFRLQKKILSLKEKIRLGGLTFLFISC
ncbi:hypothetical protein ABDB91_12855 [Desulfoscipio sp. XC116]|uniref:hypothetical protein n=1 Tax=Desulfoscipio sp. XC116 TaxID=3144975 RepID=UPI00325B7B7F